MAHIKSRKHAVPAKSPQSLTAATLLTSLALGLPASAVAQDAASGPSPDAQATTLDKVDVHGQRIKRYAADHVSSPKFTQPLVDTTQTFNVIDSDLFNEQGATTLTEALRNSPGVGTFYVGENGNTTTGDAVYMRGFDSSGSIFVDGIRDLGSISRDVFNIEQIEVAKGPAGTDNGRTAPSGAINLATKQPFQRDHGTASLSLGSDDQRRATADFNQELGDGIAFRLNLVAQDSGVPGRDEVTGKRWGVAPSIAFGLDTATRVFLNALHVDQDNVPDGGVPTIGLPGYVTPDPARPQIGAAPRVDSTSFYGTTSDHDDVVADMITARVEHDFSERMRVQNTTRWGRSHQDYMLTAFMLSVNADPALSNLQTPDIDDPSTWTVARSLPTFKDQRNTILANHTNFTAHFGSGDVQHDLSTGVEFSREELDSTPAAVLDGTSWPAASLYDPDPRVSGLEWGKVGASSHGRTDTVAVYAFDTVKFGERWQVNGGVRFDRYATDFNSKVACGTRGAPACGDVPPGTIVPGVDANVSGTLSNWKLGVLYKPAANGSIYANYAISQQPPGGSSLELSGNANNANNPIFDPQKAKTAEAGTKWQLFDDALLLTAAVYDTRVTNEIVQDPTDQQYYQTGEKRVRGVELAAVGHITGHWAVSAGFTTLDTDVINAPPVTRDGSNVLTYTPDKAGTVWTTYQFPFGLTVGGGVRYSGEMKRGTDGAAGTPEFVKSHNVWDLVASYAFTRDFDLRLNASNLFDKDYVAAINKSGYRYTPGAPRSVLLTANFRF
jgi:catecholate siderophore receptor